MHRLSALSVAVLKLRINYWENIEYVFTVGKRNFNILNLQSVSIFRLSWPTYYGI